MSTTGPTGSPDIPTISPDDSLLRYAEQALRPPRSHNNKATIIAEPLVGTAYLRKEDLAGELRLTVRQIERMHERGLAPPRFRINKRWYYSRDAVLAWLKSLEQPAPSRRVSKKSVCQQS